MNVVFHLNILGQKNVRKFELIICIHVPVYDIFPVFLMKHSVMGDAPLPPPPPLNDEYNELYVLHKIEFFLFMKYLS
jgi:hypothetical protein